METYTKAFHGGNLYLKIVDNEVERLSPADFEALSAEQQKPLQIGVYSDNHKLLKLLAASGFVLKRKCFEMQVSKADLLSPLPKISCQLLNTEKGAADYKRCAELMYQYYSDTHFHVNPLTASEAEFHKMLPAEAFYLKRDGKITDAAFIENNEIAYICSAQKVGRAEFAFVLLHCMFKQYESIFFEADDTDPVATGLNNLFFCINKRSYDTYIKP